MESLNNDFTRYLNSFTGAAYKTYQPARSMYSLAIPCLYLQSFSSLSRKAVLQNVKDLKQNAGIANNRQFYILQFSFILEERFAKG